MGDMTNEAANLAAGIDLSQFFQVGKDGLTDVGCLHAQRWTV